MQNIEIALADDNSGELEKINTVLSEKQQQLVKLAHAKKDYTDSHPLNYYKKSWKYMTIHPDSRKLLERLLAMLSRYGEERTFAYIRNVVLSGKYKYELNE